MQIRLAASTRKTKVRQIAPVGVISTTWPATEPVRNHPSVILIRLVQTEKLKVASHNLVPGSVESVMITTAMSAAIPAAIKNTKAGETNHKSPRGTGNPTAAI